MQKAFVRSSKTLSSSQDTLCCWPQDKMLYLATGSRSQGLAAAEPLKHQHPELDKQALGSIGGLCPHPCPPSLSLSLLHVLPQTLLSPHSCFF